MTPRRYGRRYDGEMFSRRWHGDEIGDLTLTAVPAAAKQIPEVIPLQVLEVKVKARQDLVTVIESVSVA